MGLQSWLGDFATSEVSRNIEPFLDNTYIFVAKTFV